MEKCRRCKREYLRDYGVVGLYNHFTGTSATPPRVIVIVCVCSCSAVNKCDDPSCRGKLLDTIINFGESLPEGKRCSTFWSTVNIFSHLFLPFPPPLHTHTHTLTHHHHYIQTHCKLVSTMLRRQTSVLSWDPVSLSHRLLTSLRYTNSYSVLLDKVL